MCANDINFSAKGRGYLFFDNNRSLPCDFTIRPHKQAYKLRCSIPPSVRDFVKTDLDDAVRFEGLTRKRKWPLSVRSFGRILYRGKGITFQVPSDAILLCGTPLPSLNEVMVFELFNFVVYRDFVTIKPQEWKSVPYWITLPLPEPWRQVYCVFLGTPLRLRERQRKLADRNWGLRTCLAMVSVRSEDNHEATSTIIDDLCLLLSFAQGTNVNWYRCGVWDPLQDKRKGYRGRSTLVGWGKPVWSVIDDKEDALQRFVAQCLPNFRKHPCRDAIRRAFALYLYAKFAPYVELHLLCCMMAIEILIDCTCAKSRDTAPKKEKHKVIEQLKQVITSSGLPQDIKGNVIRKIKEDLFRPSLRARLEALVEHLNIDVGRETLKGLCKARNRLAHAAKFPKDWDTHKVAHMERAAYDLFNQIFLRLLGYKGSYYACEPTGRTKNL